MAAKNEKDKKKKSNWGIFIIIQIKKINYNTNFF
jgi:hypothetical protein